MPKHISFRYFKPSPEIIPLAVMLYVRFPLSLKNVEGFLHERGVDVSYESVRNCSHRVKLQECLGEAGGKFPTFNIGFEILGKDLYYFGLLVVRNREKLWTSLIHLNPRPRSSS